MAVPVTADLAPAGSPASRAAAAEAGPAHEIRPFDPRLLRYASAARGYLLLTIALGLTTAGLVLAQAGLLAHALASAARGSGLSSLRVTLVALLAVVLGRAAVLSGGEAAALRAAAAVKSQLRRALTAQALRLGPAWLAGQRPGEITTLATRGLDALDPYFARYLPQLVLGTFIPLAVVARIAAADWLSAAIIALTLPLVPVFAVLIGRYTLAHTSRQWHLLAGLGGHFAEVVAGLPTLKVFGRAKAQVAAIQAATSQHRSATMAALRVAFLSALVLELAGALATALVAVEVGLRLLDGRLGYQTALLVLLLTPEAYLPLRNVGAQFHASADGAAAAGRALAILDTPPPTAPAGRTPDLRRETIELRAVGLSYPGRSVPALVDISLSIAPGDRIVLTGPSGAGKTSLLGLLLRFAEPDSGAISSGGTPLAAISLAAWRDQIAWVPQHPYLFAATIAENIALGARAATRDQIELAAQRAGAAGFIGALPRGFDTVLSERATELSAGQRQRLALARAILRDAPLVLLDEPTAHLDRAGAARFLEVISAALADRTIVMVSHHDRLPGGDLIALVDGQLAGHAGRRPAAIRPSVGLLDEAGRTDAPPAATR